MKKSAALLLAVPAMVLLVAGCEPLTDADPAASVLPRSSGLNAAATTVTDNFTIPLTITVFIPCAAGGAGELALMSGPLHVLSHVTINDNRFQAKIHMQPQGISGEGLTTGDKYQGTGVTQQTLSGSFVNAQFTTTFVNNFKIIGQGPGNNFLVHQNVHVTITPDGDVTAFVDNFSVECR